MDDARATPDDAVLAGLAGAGLELRETRDADGAAAWLITGNTFANKDLLKRHGGRWSRTEQGWLFASAAALAAVAQAAPAGAVNGGGLGDAPAAYNDDARPRYQPRRWKAYRGHRWRVHHGFLGAAPEAVLDYELLELLLFYSIDVRDTKPVARALLEHLGGLGPVFSIEPERLFEVEGFERFGPEFNAYVAYRMSEAWRRDRELPDERLDEQGRRWRAFERSDEYEREAERYWSWLRTVNLFKALREVMLRMMREPLEGRPVLGSWSALIEYLQIALAHEPVEQFRVLFLDRKNVLIRDERQQRGTVDHTPLYPRELVRRALELGASAIIMVHNHPSGDPTPSRADVEMTKQVVKALDAVGILVHDHVVVGKSRHTSFKSQRLI